MYYLKKSCLRYVPLSFYEKQVESFRPEWLSSYIYNSGLPTVQVLNEVQKFLNGAH